MIRVKRTIFWSGAAMAAFGVCALGFVIADRTGGANLVSTATFVLQLVLAGALLVIGAGGMIVLRRHRVICTSGRLVITELRTTELPLATIDDLDWSRHPSDRCIRIRAAGRTHALHLDPYSVRDAARLIAHLRLGVRRDVQRHWSRFAARRVRPSRVAECRAGDADVARLFMRVRCTVLGGAIVILATGIALAGGAWTPPLPRLALCAAFLVLITLARPIVARIERWQRRCSARARRDLWRTLVAHGAATSTSTERAVDSLDLQGDADGT